jgi:hypothetical protein
MLMKLTPGRFHQHTRVAFLLKQDEKLFRCSYWANSVWQKVCQFKLEIFEVLIVGEIEQ